MEFAVKDCALIALSMGVAAQNLRELADGIQRVEPGSIYLHFWGRMLQPAFDEPEFNNDFASWVNRALHEKQLAERLSVLNPSLYPSIDDLRREIVELIERHLDETEEIRCVRGDEKFYFGSYQMVIFDTGVKLERPSELRDAISSLSTGSIFYHFVDARRRPPVGKDDFVTWLTTFGSQYEDLIRKIEIIDPYFSGLNDIRDRLAEIFKEYFGGD